MIYWCIHKNMMYDKFVVKDHRLELTSSEDMDALEKSPGYGSLFYRSAFAGEMPKGKMKLYEGEVNIPDYHKNIKKNQEAHERSRLAISSPKQRTLNPEEEEWGKVGKPKPEMKSEETVKRGLPLGRPQKEKPHALDHDENQPPRRNRRVARRTGRRKNVV